MRRREIRVMLLLRGRLVRRARGQGRRSPAALRRACFLQPLALCAGPTPPTTSFPQLRHAWPYRVLQRVLFSLNSAPLIAARSWWESIRSAMGSPATIGGLANKQGHHTPEEPQGSGGPPFVQLGVMLVDDEGRIEGHGRNRSGISTSQFRRPSSDSSSWFFRRRSSSCDP